MGLLSGLGGFGQPTPPPKGNGNGNSGGGGATDPYGTGGTGGTTDPNETGGTGGTGGTSGTGETGGSGTTSGGDTGSGGNTGSGTGTASTGTTTNPVAPRRTTAATPKDATSGLRLDGVISETERLDLAFAFSLSEAQARRYAEAVRLTVISQQQLERLEKEDDGTRLAEGAETVRGFDRNEEVKRYDRNV